MAKVGPGKPQGLHGRRCLPNGRVPVAGGDAGYVAAELYGGG